MFCRRAGAIAAVLVAFIAALRAQPTVIAFDGGRLIIGDASALIERGTLLVEGGRITAIGESGRIAIPAGATRLDMRGRTLMPALINAHVHIGYEGFGSWGADNYSDRTVLDHLRRQAFYGVAATQTVGSSPIAESLAFAKAQQAGQFPPASRFLAVPGIAPPGGGPDAILIRGTRVLKAVTEISTADEARAAVQRMAAAHIGHVKIWVDDRRGTYPKMPPEVYEAVIAEAHRLGMTVHAHAIQMADQKAVVRAGADVLVHTALGEPLDEELMALLREQRPYWTTVVGLSDRSEACNRDPFVDQSYPAHVLDEIRNKDCAPPSPAALNRDRLWAINFPKYISSGARLVLGTDAGIDARHAFGWADHHELSRWVQAGLTPAEAIIAATSRPAALLGLADLGTLAPGKRADLLVLGANPLDAITNTRRIEDVYLNGVALDRAAMRREFQRER